MTSPLIDLRDVCFAYDASRSVLKDLSFTLEEGERVALIGPNGCGKTTLLQLVVGLVRPSAGRVTILGTDRTTEADFRDVRRHVGLLFQDSDDQLFCPTVFEDVAFGPTNLGHSHRDVHAIVRETLETLGLTHLENRITYKLSYGQKRMVALATILAMRPRLLLLDEPTTGLDAEHEERLVDILTGLPQEMVVVSHNEPFLERLVTRRFELGQQPGIELAKGM